MRDRSSMPVLQSCGGAIFSKSASWPSVLARSYMSCQARKPHYSNRCRMRRRRLPEQRTVSFGPPARSKKEVGTEEINRKRTTTKHKKNSRIIQKKSFLPKRLPSRNGITKPIDAFFIHLLLSNRRLLPIVGSELQAVHRAMMVKDIALNYRPAAPGPSSQP
jgi:hypothetical protein